MDGFDLRRKHASLGHHHENALEPQRETARRDLLAEKHADQVVVAAAAPKAAREIGHVDLHDRARVVTDSPRARLGSNRSRPAAGVAFVRSMICSTCRIASRLAGCSRTNAVTSRWFAL